MYNSPFGWLYSLCFFFFFSRKPHPLPIVLASLISVHKYQTQPRPLPRPSWWHSHHCGLTVGLVWRAGRSFSVNHCGNVRAHDAAHVLLHDKRAPVPAKSKNKGD